MSKRTKDRSTPDKFTVSFAPSLLDEVRPWAEIRKDPHAPKFTVVEGVEVRVEQDAQGALIFKISKGPWDTEGEKLHGRRN